MSDLLTIFQALNRPARDLEIENFTTTLLDGVPYRIGKDGNGSPVFLIPTSVTITASPIHLEHLDVRHSERCRVTGKNGEEEGTYTIIRCVGASEELVAYFLRSVDPVLRSLGPTPTSTEIISAIEHLTELFRALAQPPMMSVAGLWAELFVIANSKDPEELICAWHSTPEDKYDFNAGSQRIEVKSTSGRERRHHFSYDQLIPPSGGEVVIASLFVERSGGGLSLGDLLERVRAYCTSTEQLQRVDRVVAQTLGNSLNPSLGECFDAELARESLQIFRASDIPMIAGEVPWGVSDIRFISDLSRSTKLSKEVLSEKKGIFSVVLA